MLPAAATTTFDTTDYASLKLQQAKYGLQYAGVSFKMAFRCCTPENRVLITLIIAGAGTSMAYFGYVKSEAATNSADDKRDDMTREDCLDCHNDAEPSRSICGDGKVYECAVSDNNNDGLEGSYEYCRNYISETGFDCAALCKDMCNTAALIGDYDAMFFFAFIVLAVSVCVAGVGSCGPDVAMTDRAEQFDALGKFPTKESYLKAKVAMFEQGSDNGFDVEVAAAELDKKTRAAQGSTAQ